jgi:Fe-S-cluster containining protein
MGPAGAREGERVEMGGKGRTFAPGPFAARRGTLQPVQRPEELDCLTCGACCRTGADGRILIPGEDLVRWRALGRPDLAEATQPGHFGMVGFATRPDGSCVHLGTDANARACCIYDLRGTTCREFEKGSPQCLEFRRDFGVR